MTLNSDYSKCSLKPTTDADRAVLSTFIEATVVVGISEITSKNVGEFYARIHLLEKVHGAWMSTIQTNGLKPRPITPLDCASVIGLSTNASEMSRSAFLKCIGRRMDSWANGGS